MDVGAVNAMIAFVSPGVATPIVGALGAVIGEGVGVGVVDGVLESPPPLHAVRATVVANAKETADAYLKLRLDCEDSIGTIFFTLFL